jgi:hypothetical protein
MLETEASTTGRTRAAGALSDTVTHRVGRAQPGTVRLWSIQPLAVWEQHRRHQHLYVDLSWIDGDQYLLDHLWMYDWMREQMAQRLSGYGGHYPWWAHFRPKPDLRRRIWEIEPYGSRHVRLETAIDTERVLLSNLEAWWHGIGERWYVPIDDADGDAWHAEMQRQGRLLCEWPLPEPWHSRRAASWERIFDVDTLARGGWWPDSGVQATFERLDLADVVGVTEFTARGRPFPEET